MMDVSQVKAIVDLRINWLRWALGLQDWSIQVFYSPLEEQEHNYIATGKCCLHPEYMQASIYLDPAALDDEEEVLRIFLHEMLHVVAAPFHTFRTFVSLDNDPKKLAVSDTAYTHAMELMICNLERILSVQLGLTVDNLCAHAENYAGKSSHHQPSPSKSRTKEVGGASSSTGS